MKWEESVDAMLADRDGSFDFSCSNDSGLMKIAALKVLPGSAFKEQKNKRFIRPFELGEPKDHSKAKTA